MTSADLTPELTKQLQAVVGAGGWLTDEEALAPYVHDWPGFFTGRTPMVLRPATTEQVSAIMRLCAEAGVAIVPQGGNTGYMGGATPDESGRQVIVSLARMNRVREVDAANYTLTVEAGCILQQVQQAADEAGLYFPLSLGAEGTCQIGGNLSTNAGGTAVLRYGNARDLALGLEVVLPDGRVWHGLRRLRKNNTGYDFRHLFIGAEGTLGIITAAVLKLFPQPQSVATAMVALPDLAAAVNLLSHLRRYSGDLVTGFEYIDGAALELVAAHVPDSRVPLRGHEHVALVELAGGAPGEDLSALLEQALAAAFEADLATDAVIADNLTQRAAFWHARE
ncbi:MAG TPA: FAD-binding oxidoreductase, partial [Salinisphaeraceae bacterium]|nr:FAD-binding oxidoreductase [Salinisphaeraceae bacterium]